MFFKDRVKNIKSTDRVLEVGPGACSHPRSDILLEKRFEDKAEASAQRGHAPEIKTDKKIIFYDGDKFPFKDNEFDYVICSHVLEHVEDVDGFISELKRVAKAGYIEYPLIYYDYLYDISEHVNLLKRKGNKIYWMQKEELQFDLLKPVNLFFNESLKAGHTAMIRELKEFLFEGFEWVDVIESEKTKKIQDLTFQDIKFPKVVKKKGFLNRLKRALRKKK